MSDVDELQAVRVQSLEQEDDESAAALVYGVAAEPFRLQVTANVPLVADNGEWLPAALVMAMSRGVPLHIQGSQDSVALSNASGAQKLLSGWYKDLTNIPISADEITSDHGTAAGRGVGCFFSGGADSFYSAIGRSDDITHLIFVTGFDIDIEDEALAAQALNGAREAAAALGKNLIEVKTNIRRMSDGVLDWGTHYHGAALATIGLLLAQVLERVVIPASYHIDDLFPWGSHPQLDPYWDSSAIVFEHHGEFASRPEKIAHIATNDAAMDHLRICWENTGGAFNCGTCEKCLRTMVNLRVVGALERCRTLPDDIDIQRLRSFRPGHGAAVFAKQNLAAMKSHGIDDRDLVRALQLMVRTAPLWDAIRKVKRGLLLRRSS